MNFSSLLQFEAFPTSPGMYSITCMADCDIQENTYGKTKL